MRASVRRTRLALACAAFIACCAFGSSVVLRARPVARSFAQQPARPPDIYFTGTPQPVVYEMLKLAGHPVVMGNAAAELVASAREWGWQIAPTNDEDGVAQVIEDVLCAQYSANFDVVE